MGLLRGASAYTAVLQRRAEVWAKGRIIPDFDPAVWRWDAYGSVMKCDEHGNRNSEHGWEIDHIIPDCLDGSDDLSNLRPLNWRNTASLGGLLGDALGKIRQIR